MERIAELLARMNEAENLSDEELGQLTEDLRAAVTELLESGDLTTETLATAQEATAAFEQLAQIQEHRAEEAAERTAQASELLARLNGEASAEDDGEVTEATEPEAEAEAEAETTETETVEAETEEEELEAEEPERIAASAEPTPAPAPAPRVTRMAPRAPDLRPRPRPSKQPALALRASANVPGVVAGETLTGEKLGIAFGETIRASLGYRGPRVSVPVATIGAYDPTEMFGEERTLDDNPRRNETKIDKVCSYEAIRASGGQCAPTPVDYTQPIIGTDARPVRDVLARFAADRGGVRLIPPPSISTVSAAIDTWTHATDVTPGGDTKNCLTMTCPSDVETFVDAITTCIKVGNFRQQYWPEQVDAWVQKAAQAAARTAEQKLLTAIGAGSANLTHATGLGTARDVLATLDLATAGLRNRQRVSPTMPLRLIAPAWLLNNFRADLTRQAPGDSGGQAERLAQADAEIEAFFRQRNVNVQWTLDGETGQDFGAQIDGPLDGWPSHVIMYLYVEGTWLHLDGGQLNLGVIRDSTLVGTNDFIMFSEFMENAAFHGNESMRIDIDICPNGKAAALASYDPCSGGS